MNVNIYHGSKYCIVTYFLRDPVLLLLSLTKQKLSQLHYVIHHTRMHMHHHHKKQCVNRKRPLWFDLHQPGKTPFFGNFRTLDTFWRIPVRLSSAQADSCIYMEPVFVAAIAMQQHLKMDNNSCLLVHVRLYKADISQLKVESTSYIAYYLKNKIL